MEKEELDPEIQTVLKEQCRRVGADFEKMDFGNKDWFWEYKWTLEEEKDFEKWLVDHWITSKESRLAMVEGFTAKKSRLQEAAREWCFLYGWKYKD